MSYSNSIFDEYNAMGGSSSDEASGRDSLAKKLARKQSTVDKAFKKRKDDLWDEKWSQQVQLYSNKYPWDELGDYKDIVVPNMIFSTVNVIVPSVAVHAPKISVNAKREQDEFSANVAEAVVNHQWRELDVQDEIREAVKDMVVMGHGWVKVTWKSESAERQLGVDEWRANVQQALMERQQAVEMSDLDELEFPSVQEVAESVPRTIEEVVVDAPDVSRVSPFDMVVDPDALRLRDARWIAQRSFVPLSVAQKKEEWQGSARRKLKPVVMSEVRDTAEIGFEQQKSDDASFVVVYEYYDLLSGTMCTFAQGCKEFLVKPTESPFPNVHPYILFENYEVPERFYPMSDIECIYGLQLELALTRTQMINDRKSGRRIGMVRSAAIGAEGMEALESGEDEVLLDVVEDRPFADVFQMMQPTGLHPEWYNQTAMILDDINMVSGVSEYARGNMPEIKRTATEAGLIQDAANARSADKLFKVEQGMARVAEQMIRLTQMFMDTEDVAKVVDDNQVVAWVQYSRQNLKGDFAFEVEAGSSQPQNESFKRQSALQLLDVLSGSFGTGLLNEQKVLEHVMRNGFGIKNAQEFLGPGMPPPMPEPGMEEMPPEGMPGAPPEGMPPMMSGM